MEGCDKLPVPVDWDPIAAASAESAFIAVMAGFVFLGIVYVLTDDQRRRGGILVLFIASFLCLAAGSYVAVVVSGESPCLRAWSELMFVSGLMAVGVVTMLAGIAWLLPDYYGAQASTRGFLLASVVLIGAVAVELVATTTRAYLLDIPIERIWRDRAAWLSLAGLVVLLSFLVGRVYLKSKRKLADRQQTRVNVAAWCVFGFVILSLAMVAIVGDRPANLWVQPEPWVVWASVVVPNAGGLIAIGATLWALPTKGTWTTANGAVSESSK